MELGCGTGRCLIPLIREGFDVVGLDLSQPMLDRLGAKLQLETEEVRRRASTMVGDGRTFSLPLVFGMAFMGAGSFTLMLTKEQQLDLLEAMYGHLRAGGLLVIDAFNPLMETMLSPGREIHKVGDHEVVEDAGPPDQAEQIIPMVTTYRRDGQDLASVHWNRRYTFRFELEHLVERSGFRILHLWGDYSRHPFGEALERLFLVAQKPDEGTELLLEQAASVVVETTK